AADSFRSRWHRCAWAGSASARKARQIQAQASAGLDRGQKRGKPKTERFRAKWVPVRVKKTRQTKTGSVRPGEGDLVERLRPELFRRAGHHAAAQRAIEFGRRLVVGQRPDHHALEAALHEVAARGVEQAAAEAQPL